MTAEPDSDEVQSDFQRFADEVATAPAPHLAFAIGRLDPAIDKLDKQRQR